MVLNFCIPVTEEQIRGELIMDDGVQEVVLAKTPFLLNFNVSKSRSQQSTTCSVVFEIQAGFQFPLNANLVIKAGLRNNLKKIFSGLIESTTVEPTFGKPSYLKVTLQGRGILTELENKTFSRRLRTDGQGLFCLITGGGSNRPSSYTSLDRKATSGNRQVRARSPDPSKATGEHSPLIEFVDPIASQQGGGALTAIASKPTGNSNNGGTSGLTVHDHSDLDNGGPAFAVYSAD